MHVSALGYASPYAIEYVFFVKRELVGVERESQSNSHRDGFLQPSTSRIVG
jgi:hypothetical protein